MRKLTGSPDRTTCGAKWLAVCMHLQTEPIQFVEKHTYIVNVTPNAKPKYIAERFFRLLV